MLAEGDVVLEIQGQRVAGFTRSDIEAKLKHSLKNGNPVVVKTVPKGKSLHFKSLVAMEGLYGQR